MLRDMRYRMEPDDGENLRRIGRSLSGTVVTPHRSRLTATRSFVSVTSFALLPPCGCAFKLHLPDVPPWHFIHCFFPVLFSPNPAVCLVSSFCPALSVVPLSASFSFPLSLSKVKQADVSASPCLLPLF